MSACGSENYMGKEYEHMVGANSGLAKVTGLRTVCDGYVH